MVRANRRTKSGRSSTMTRGLQHFIDEWRRERPDVDLTAFIIAGAIKQIDQQTEAEFRRLSAKLGIGPGDLRVVLALRRSGVDNPHRPTDLFQALLVTSGAVTKQVDRLQSEGLIQRLPDPSYKRGSLIRLTRRGTKVADTALEAICSDKTTIGAAISSLTDEDREIGKQFLQRLLAKFEAVSNAEGAASALPDRPREAPSPRLVQSTNSKPSRGRLASGTNSIPRKIRG
jgi:DNA-binding MarR family transcriptional regulator